MPITKSIEIIESYIDKVESGAEVSQGLKDQVRGIIFKAERAAEKSEKWASRAKGRPLDTAKEGYDFSKPYQAQDMDPEWDDYAWSADDF